MEVLFRGRCEANGLWYKGFLYKDRFIISGDEDDMHGEYSNTIDKTWIDTYMSCVAPETVGQYIGCEDKNGKKIFKGDIVKCTPEECIAWIPGSNVVGEVCDDRRDGIMVRQLATGITWRLNCFCEVEVIGNIHDNPELLTPKREVKDGKL